MRFFGIVGLRCISDVIFGYGDLVRDSDAVKLFSSSILYRVSAGSLSAKKTDCAVSKSVKFICSE